MSDDSRESTQSEEDYAAPADDDCEEGRSFTESVMNGALEAQDAEEDSYSEGLLYDEYQESGENIREYYQETVENRAMRETMQQMVSSAIPDAAAGDSIDEDIVVLSPEHPMLQSFHKSVTNHLQKQKNLLLNDIRELSAKVKATRRDTDDKAETLYGMQQTANRQRTQLDIKCDNLATDTETRQELENMVQELKERHKQEQFNVQTAQTCEETLWRKLNERTEKEYGAHKRKEEEDLQLAAVKRATEKAEIDKKILADEKKKQDEFVYRLTCEVTELQSRFTQLKAQLQSKLEEQTRLKQAHMSATDDLEMQTEEHQRLIQAWQRLLISAQHKDEAHKKLMTQKQVAEEESRILDSKIERFKREGGEEMLQNEKLTLCAHRLERDLRQFERQQTSEKQTIEEEQIKLDATNTMLKMTQQDLNKALIIMKERQEKIKLLDKDIAVLNTEQHSLEEKILEALNNQATQDKMIYSTIKSVEKKNKELEELESQVSQRESDVAVMGVELQKLRFHEACTLQLVAQQQATVNEAQEEVNSTRQQLRQAQLELKAKQSMLDSLNIQLGKLLVKTGGKEISVTEIKNKEMEDMIKELTKEINSLQKKVLRKEVSLLEHTQMLDNLKQEIEASKTNLANLQHKSQAQKEAVDEALQQEAQLKRKTELELHALSCVDKDLAKLRKIKEDLEKNNAFAYNDILAARKEEQLEVNRLEAEIAEFEAVGDKLRDTLSELQTQQVDLEAKVTLATETKQAIEHERGSSGEIAALKSEIHRMEVRLGQLKRTQDRLTQDLDQCVLRRDAMVDAARARNTRNAASNFTQIKNVRKLESLKQSNKQFKTKLRKYQAGKDTFKTLEEEIEKLKEEVAKKKNDITKLKESYDLDGVTLENQSTKKKQNLEQLVHEQKRCRGLADAKEGRYKPACRSEQALVNEAQKQRVIRTNLISVVESLRPDFPKLHSQLSCISALLKIIKISYTTDPTTNDEAQEQT